MTIAFMGLVCSQIVDRISIRAGLVLLVPMLLMGAASVIYWRITERAGAGNVVPYGVLQGYSVVILLLLAVLKPSRYTHGKILYWVFAWYVLSKILETYDTQVLAWSHLFSGHTLKHVAAAVAGRPIREPDPAKRATYYAEVQKLTAEAAPIVWLHELTFPTIINKRYKDVIVSPVGIFPSYNRAWLDR